MLKAKATIKVFAFFGAGVIGVVSTSCTNQQKLEQTKRCDTGEAAVEVQLDKVNVLGLQAKSLYQQSRKAYEGKMLGLQSKLIDKMEDNTLEVAQATELLVARWEEYVEACQDEEREDKFRQEKLKPVFTRLENITGN